MDAFFCGIHLAVMVGLAIMFALCVNKTNSPAKLSFMITCFSLFLLILGMYMELVESDTTQDAIMALKLQYVGLYPFLLSLLFFSAGMGGFRISKPFAAVNLLADIACLIAVVSTGTTQAKNHGLFYSDMRIEYDGIYPRIVVDRGIFWYITYALLFITIGYISVRLIIALKGSDNKIQRRRIKIMLVGIAVVTAELIMKGVGLFGSYNPFACGAFILILCMYFSMIHYGFFSSVSSAPANALNIGSEGVIIIGENGTLIYINSVAKRLFPEAEQAKSPKEYKAVDEAVSLGRSTLELDGSLYELRSDKIEEYSSPCGYIVWIVNMTDIQRQMDRINAANAAKTEFLARMSHEIRTPINTILGLNEVIGRTTADKEVQECSADIAEAGDMLLELVNEILDISKAESGKLTIVDEEYSTAEMFGEIYSLVAHKAEDKGLKLEFFVDPQLPCRLIGDKSKIKQTAVNLLVNAVKYTERGYVRLNAKMRESTLVISVSDSGVGISEDKLPLVFNNFERIGAKGDGVGLGLPIVKKLAELMGGGITVESTPGQGSVFTARIPQKIGDSAPMGAFSPDSARTRKIGGTLFYNPNAEILAVDDNRFNLTVIKKLLLRTGAHITTAESGRRCLELAQKSRFDIILLDVMMPEISGEETLKRLRETQNGNIPVIAVTADAVVGAREHYISEGFDDYLSKPIISSELEMLLCKFLPQGSAERDTLNIQNGLRYSDNDMDFYYQLLGIFAEEAPDALSRMESALSDNRLSEYAVLVHGLKNSARGVGADSAADICYKSECAAKEGNLSAVNKLHSEIAETVTEAVNKAKGLICAAAEG